MRADLKERISLMQQKLSNSQPLAEVHVDTQLFVTPDEICCRLVNIAGVVTGDRVLEPSAGTGAILRALLNAVPDAHYECVEMNVALSQHLKTAFPSVAVVCDDFLNFMPEMAYQRIVMNSPFRNGADVKHIQHARTMLAPGGCLVGICLNGPRQQKALLPLASHHEVLPRGTFTYTDVSTMIVRIDAR